MYYVYVIRNPQGDLYKGHTNCIERRVFEHNLVDGKFSKYTKNQGPWVLVHKEEYLSRGEAMKREKHLKTGKGRDELDRILGITR